MATLKLDMDRLDKAAEAVYRLLEVGTETPWAELKRRAQFDSAAIGQVYHCQRLARASLEAYATRRDGRWLR